MKHKVVYTATNVTCGWAGAVIRKANQSIWAGAVTQEPPKRPKKLTQTYRPMDGLTSHACNKAGYTATLVVPGWAGAVLEKVTGATGQELYAQKTQKLQKSK